MLKACFLFNELQTLSELTVFFFFFFDYILQWSSSDPPVIPQWSSSGPPAVPQWSSSGSRSVFLTEFSVGCFLFIFFKSLKIKSRLMDVLISWAGLVFGVFSRKLFHLFVLSRINKEVTYLSPDLFKLASKAPVRPEVTKSWKTLLFFLFLWACCQKSDADSCGRQGALLQFVGGFAVTLSEQQRGW